MDKTAASPVGDPVDQVTKWLKSWSRGDRKALDGVLPLVYEELRAVARRVRRRERPDHSLVTTALVHEAYLKLGRRRSLEARDRSELVALSGLAMRQVLVDHARAHLRVKRGSGERPLPLEVEGIDLAIEKHQAEELLDAHRALKKLAKVSPRATWIVQQRIFVGATMEEIAVELDLSRKTVQRDWATGIAWLRKEVRRQRAAP